MRTGKPGRQRMVWGALGLLALGTMGAGSAFAGCAPSVNVLKPMAWESGEGGLQRAVFMQVNASSEFEPFREREAIVGLWKFTFMSKGNAGIPDGTVLDAGYATWHSDGTEIMNSGRAPKTQSFCMGAWEQTGRQSYKLNHFAMSWDDSGSVYVGPTNIRESVTVDNSAKHYTGTFTLVQYATDEKTVLASVKGIITAARVTVDSKLGD